LTTLAGFKGSFHCINKRAPTEQEIFDAGVAEGMRRESEARVLSDDARECLQDVVSHHHDLYTACLFVKSSNETTRSDELYWQKQIDVLSRMRDQAVRALAASPTPAPAKAEAWMHRRSGALLHEQSKDLCDARRNSGIWMPLGEINR
jgi:hypothetical protein